MCLIGAGEYREFPNETYFVFISNGNVVRFVSKMNLIARGCIEWEICKVIDGTRLSNKDMTNITSALLVFQVWGEPEEKGTAISVIFNVNT